MNTLQIERLLKKDLKSKAIFKKVCALDQLEKPTFPSANIINSDPSSEPGEHWVAVYFDKRGRGEYFDSYGLPPILVGLESYMDVYSLSGWIYNRKTLQAYFSSFCGHYCVYFILFRCRGVPLHAIVSDFTSNLTENDRSISRFIHNVSQH